MKSAVAIVAAILCYIVAMGMEVQAQWHLTAPVHGCVEVSHSAGGSYYRTYFCDGTDGEFSLYS